MIRITKLTLYQADCLQALKELEEGSIDSIITDPPYALTSTTKPRIDHSGDKEVPFSRQQSRSGGFMGMEREEQYIRIAKGRLQWKAMQKMGNIECVQRD